MIGPFLRDALLKVIPFYLRQYGTVNFTECEAKNLIAFQNRLLTERYAERKRAEGQCPPQSASSL